MRRMTMLLVCGLVCAGAACGSSTAKVGTPPVTTAPAASTSPPSVAVTTTTSAPTPVTDACSLATAADLAAALGARPTAPGNPTKYEATYVTCDWSATAPGAANANSLRLAVVEKKTPDQPGFSVPTDLPDAHPIAGLGDKATMYSRGGTFTGLDLIAEKGKFVISLNGQYGGTAPTQAALETAFEAVVRKAFVTLGA